MIETIVLVGFAGLILYGIRRSSRFRPGPAVAAQAPVVAAVEPSEHDRAAQLVFNNVFAIMSDARRESLLSMYMGRDRCSRTEAMKKAVTDRQKDSDLAF